MKFIDLFFRFVIPAYEVLYQTTKYPNLIRKRAFQAELLYRFIPLTFFFGWVFSLVPIIGDFLFLSLILVSAGWMYYYSDLKKQYLTVLIYLIVAVWGFLGIWSFIGHTVLADDVARSIGWEQGSPFQLELAFYHLGLALASLSLLWSHHKSTVLAVILGKGVFLFGAMGIHLFEAWQSENFNVGNFGIRILLADLIIPILVIVLYKKAFKK